MILWTKFSPKALFLIQNRTNEHHHQVQDIRTNLGNNFQLNLTALILWIKYAQKMSSRLKQDKWTWPSNSADLNWIIKAGKAWTPNTVSKTCVETLRQCIKGMKTMHFRIPMILREPRSHVYHYYFRVNPAYGFTKKTKHKIPYPDFLDISEISKSSSLSRAFTSVGT